jgi:hypothetical protein
MLDDATSGASTALPRCMWCSAELPSDSEITCPTCGATLIGEGDNQVPGVTAIDAEAIIRAGRDSKPRPRSRLMSWISGEYVEEEKPAPPGSLTPPPPEVRREMLRLELEAQVANLQAEAGAIAAEQAVEAVEAGEAPEVAAADAAAMLAVANEAAGSAEGAGDDTNGTDAVAAAPEPEPDAVPVDGAAAAADETTG